MAFPMQNPSILIGWHIKLESELSLNILDFAGKNLQKESIIFFRREENVSITQESNAEVFANEQFSSFFFSEGGQFVLFL